MDDDVRKNYILSTAANFFQKDPNEFGKKFFNEKNLSKFLDDLNILLLVINSSRDITFTIKLENVSSLSGKSLLFFKTNAESITPENMKSSILMSSIVDSPVDTLFYLIHNVYSPVLQIQQSQNSKGQDAYDAKLTNTLADLESNLKIAIRRSEEGSSNKRSTLSPLDEFQYWSDMSERGKNKDAKERAAFFFSEFEPLIKFYKKIDTCPVQEIMEIIEATQDSYDYIWQQVDYEPIYSQERMINLLEITGF